MSIYLARAFHRNILDKCERSQEKAAFLLESAELFHDCGHQSATWWPPGVGAAALAPRPSTQRHTVMHDGWGVCLTDPFTV